MKTLISIITVLTLTISATAQRQISYGYTEITKTQFDSCSKTSYLTANAQIIKQSGKLIVPVSGKPAKIFKDDSSDENYHEFEFWVTLKGQNSL